MLCGINIGDSSSKAYPSSSHNPTRKISIRAEGRGGRGERGLVEADRGKGEGGGGGWWKRAEGRGLERITSELKRTSVCL